MPDRLSNNHAYTHKLKLSTRFHWWIRNGQINNYHALHSTEPTSPITCLQSRRTNTQPWDKQNCKNYYYYTRTHVRVRTHIRQTKNSFEYNPYAAAYNYVLGCTRECAVGYLRVQFLFIIIFIMVYIIKVYTYALS